MLIKDLELAQDLSREQAAAVRGCGPNGNADSDAIVQGMALNVPVALLNGSASNNNVDVHGDQYAKQKTFQYAGDSFLALLPVLPFAL
jgi:hypothetical protein